MAKQAEKFLTTDAWSVIEEGFHAERNQVAESIFSLGNEYCGVRGYMEEGASVPSLQGCYFNGVYEWAEKENESAYKGIIRCGHYMVNAVDFLKTQISLDGERLDIAKQNICGFIRKLDFRTGVYERSFTLLTAQGRIFFRFSRFLSMEHCEYAYQKIEIVSDYPVSVDLYMGLDFDTKHWGKKGRWEKISGGTTQRGNYILAKTQTTDEYILSEQRISFSNGAEARYEENGLGGGLRLCATVNGAFTAVKQVKNLVDREGRKKEALVEELGITLGYEKALSENVNYWNRLWQKTDIEIEGDEDNQQGIRFCIFQLQQTYHGLAPKDNIGAKGLTGEAYSGHAFWDTETYCLPFYLFNNLDAAKDLLLFRYHTLEQAKARAKMLDCAGACYPIATLNGYEACDLWQHASLQFQPSTGVAYGIRHYVNVSNDERFLLDYGLEMLVEICRFLRSRGDFNADRTKFGYFCVMGPDEFQMMVNHNCYTNYMAKKTFEYTLSVLEKYRQTKQCAALGITEEEKASFAECAEKMYLPYDEPRKLFEQHEGFFNLPHVDVKSIPVTDFPLYHHWSYDRIYRNDMIKQPDVLMFMLLYSGDFSYEQKLANYEFYEPRCIHESSLSPSVHSILASELGKEKEALDFFGFASRLDLDDYNRNSCEGLHTTSIAAAWLNIVYGFGGVRSDGEKLILNPTIPSIWKSYSFKLNYKGCNIGVKVTQDTARITVVGGTLTALVRGREETFRGERVFAL